jgi:acetyl-CoA carboxylase biotin carboxyl carrier protein
MASPDPKDIESLVELFNQSEWDEMHLKTDTLEIFLSNDPNAIGPSQSAATPLAEPVLSAGVATQAPAATENGPVKGPAAVYEIADGMVAVSAPNLGTFYRAPKPGAPPYVEVGQKVTADTEVCLIEVMKLFTPVRAGAAGVVSEVCVEDGQMIEFGQVLVVIDPD